MILVSHRGNTIGPEKAENSPDLILETLSLGFDVEFDLWSVDGKLMTGHDAPKYDLDPKILTLNRLWIHAKNIEALTFLQDLPYANYFWHDTDHYTVTSQGHIWAYPGMILKGKGIAVILGKDLPAFPCQGVCSDFVGLIKSS